jgi:nitrite reductase/ring-hydroxylating ferredoxin subunit
MYPFDTASGIVRNRWYIAAFSDEITRDPIERTLLGKPVVMYRKQDGSVVAMYGICPHRYYPLAKGKVEGDRLVCGYHGFVFDETGKCAEIPSQGTGADFCQPVYPVIEKGPLCWIWLGDKEQCNPGILPPYEDFGLGEEGWHYSSPNYFRLAGRTQLLIDNLMDLTHLPYIHYHLGGGEAMKSPKVEMEDRERSLRVSRTGKVPFSDFHQHVFGEEMRFEGLSDFLSLTDFYGPELIRTSLPITLGIDGQDSVPAGLGALYILHGMTPETESSTHYFGFAVRNFRQDSEEVDEFWRQSDIKIRQQDVDAIEAVETRLEVSAALQKELLVVADRPASKVRMIIHDLLKQEQR